MKHYECEYRMITLHESDSWYWQPHENNQIELSVMLVQFRHGECLVKITAWGCDDFGVEQEFVTHNFNEAKERYEFWKNGLYQTIPDGVDYDWFMEEGFHQG